MPTYEMTASEQQQYGTSLNIWQALRLLQTWHPLISYGQRFVGESDPYRKSLIVSEALEWLAGKTDSPLDDQLVRHVADVAKTPQGEALVRFCLSLAGV
jgi:hypothetical protein